MKRRLRDPLVSVVVPAWNAAATLREALESVRRQHEGPPREILLVDDGSTDGTACVAERWHAEFPLESIRIWRQETNQGPAAARNAALRYARGEWVAFLDADDLWCPNRLTWQLRLAADYPDVALWCGATCRIDAAACETDGDQKGTDTPPDFRYVSLHELAVLNSIPLSTVLIRRSVLEEAGGFDERFRGPEDYELWLRLAVRHRIGKISACLAICRERSDGLSQDDRRFLPEIQRMLDKAYGPDGPLASWRTSLRRRAMAEQYVSASWMAWKRGARTRAIRLLLSSWLWYPGWVAREEADRNFRLKLLLRYLREAPSPAAGRRAGAA